MTAPVNKETEHQGIDANEPVENGADFRSAMSDVAPIEQDARVQFENQVVPTQVLKRRRLAATEEASSKQNSLSGDYIKPVDPYDVLEFKRSGIQHGVYKNLRLGKYSVDARMDLHGLSVEQARHCVSQFVKDCVANDVRCALVTHGKGVNRKPQPALLKSCIAHWLPQLDEVLAFHSAQKHHGGVGATYLLLRKSEKKRQENYEKHQKRS